MSAVKPSPTRITLLAKKRELKIAKRGHKLLKDKQDGLMREFLSRIKDAQALREQLQTQLQKVFSTYVSASTLMSPQNIQSTFATHCARTKISTTERQVMSVKIPSFRLEDSSSTHGSVRPYGLLETYGNIDYAQAMLADVLPHIVHLAETESAVTRLAEEIERTRRRASALEHIRIPHIEHTIRDVTLRLEEQNRDAIVSTMRVKALISK
jgi:V/A-type H+-transporting ATPase subunit D